MAGDIQLNQFLLTDVDALRGIIDAVPHPIFVKDEQTRFVVINEMMCRLMNHSYEELIGRTDYDFVPKEQADVFRGNDLRVLQTGETNENEELFSDGDGNLRTIVTRKKRLVLPNGATLLVGTINDISDFRRAEALIRQHADHDALTGLVNRRRFYEKVETALARVEQNAEGCCMLLVDLDRFKPVNDSHGHTAGDAVLVEVARRLEAVVRRGDTVARIGGDEFAIICPGEKGETAEDGRRLASRLINALKKPITVGSVSVEIGACVGIAQYPVDGSSGEALLHAADIAMYRAKHDGRGRWRFFEASMDVEIRERAELEAELRLAIDANAIDPYFQPLVDLSDGRLLGFEILARWQHARRGFIAPDAFIPLAEKLGLIDELTFALLRKAVAEAITWPDDLSLALNIAPSQLTDGLLPVQILGVLKEVGFPPNRLEIEMTESALVSNLDAARSIIASFQNLGIRVALDDFGTGYSSLHHLRELRFDKIKIDRSFVQSMRTNEESHRVVSAILGLAKSLGLAATAEGIENAEAMAEVTRGGAETGQGYYFGRAIPASEVRAMIESGGDHRDPVAAVDVPVRKRVRA